MGTEIEDIQLYVHVRVITYQRAKYLFLKIAYYGLLLLYYRKYTTDPIFLPQAGNKTRRNITLALFLATCQKLINANSLQ